MRAELLTAVREAEEFEPSGRAAALLRIARVFTKIDQTEAERLLDRGLALLAELPEPERSAITPQATCLAACVSPGRAFDLRSASSDPLLTDKFLFDMVRHGHGAAAAEYLAHWSDEGAFPYDAALDTMSHVQGDAARLQILRFGMFAPTPPAGVLAVRRAFPNHPLRRCRVCVAFAAGYGD